MLTFSSFLHESFAPGKRCERECNETILHCDLIYWETEIVVQSRLMFEGADASLHPGPAGRGDRRVGIHRRP